MDIASLLSDQAQKFIQDHLSDNLADLMLGQKGVPGLRLRELVQQIKARQIARDKIPLWFSTPGIVYGESKSLEQCSSELTATYKSQLISGISLIDLTGGMGVDSFFLGRNFENVTYVEEDPELCSLAGNNFQALKVSHVQIIQQNAEGFIEKHSQPVDWVYIDPDRRAGDHRRVKIEDCQPDILSLLEQLWGISSHILLKLSPMLDVQAAVNAFRSVKAVHVVSVKNECKELVLKLEKDFNGAIDYTAINFTSNSGVQSLTFNRQQEQTSESRYSKPLAYIYEPNSSLMKLAAFKFLAERFKLMKLHPNSHLYTSDDLVEDFPGRSFEVRWVNSYKPGRIRKLLPNGKANIAVRNFPKDVKTIRKECNLSDGGKDYLFATTGPGEQLMVINGNRCPEIPNSKTQKSKL